MRLRFAILGILAGVGLNACLFSPAKTATDFPLSARVWTGVQVDSATSKRALSIPVSLEFGEEGVVVAVVGEKRGAAHFGVYASGRMQLGFADEPLIFSNSRSQTDNESKIIYESVSAWLPAFLGTVDRFLEKDHKLYLKSATYPEVMLTLVPGDTTFGGIDNPPPTDTTIFPNPQPVDTTPVKPGSTYTLPKDYPVYGGKEVPADRVQFFKLLVNAWTVWSKSGIRDYQFSFEENSTGMYDRNGWITVSNGVVTGFESNSGAWQSESFSQYPRVESLFAQIGLLVTQPIRRDEVLDGQFNEYGVPTQFQADPLFASSGDEVYFNVPQFNPTLIITTPIGVDSGAWHAALLINKSFVVSALQVAGKAIPVSSNPSLYFDAKGGWSVQFQCNHAEGNYSQLSDGRVQIKIVTRSFIECGEGDLVEGLAKLLDTPVYLDSINDYRIRIRSQDKMTSVTLDLAAVAWIVDDVPIRELPVTPILD